MVTRLARLLVALLAAAAVLDLLRAWRSPAPAPELFDEPGGGW